MSLLPPARSIRALPDRDGPPMVTAGPSRRTVLGLAASFAAAGLGSAALTGAGLVAAAPAGAVTPQLAGTPDAAVLDPATGRLFVVGPRLQVFDAASGARVAVLPISAVTLALHAGVLYVGHARQIDTVDPVALTVGRRFAQTVGYGVDRIAWVNQRLWVSAASVSVAGTYPNLLTPFTADGRIGRDSSQIAQGVGPTSLLAGAAGRPGSLWLVGGDVVLRSYRYDVAGDIATPVAGPGRSPLRLRSVSADGALGVAGFKGEVKEVAADTLRPTGRAYPGVGLADPVVSFEQAGVQLFAAASGTTVRVFRYDRALPVLIVTLDRPATALVAAAGGSRLLAVSAGENGGVLVEAVRIGGAA